MSLSILAYPLDIWHFEPSEKMIEYYLANLVWLFLLNPVSRTVQHVNVAEIRAGRRLHPVNSPRPLERPPVA